MNYQTEESIRKLAGQDFAALFFGPVMDWNEHATGQRLMEDAVLAGDDLARTLWLASCADEGRRSCCQRIGALDGLLRCLDAFVASGRHVFNVRSDFSLAVEALQSTGDKRRAIVRSTPPNRGADMLRLLLQAGRAAGPYLKRAEPVAPPPPPAAPALVVNAVLQLPEGPLPMAIVSQPATRSVQTVERDAEDEIVRTVTETTPHG